MTVDELIKGVNIALGTTSVDACPSFDVSGDGAVTVDEVIAAVNRALNGCATPTTLLIPGLSIFADGPAIRPPKRWGLGRLTTDRDFRYGLGAEESSKSI